MQEECIARGQSLRRSKGVFDWKYSLLRNLVATPPQLRLGNGKRQAYRFTTLSLPELTPYYNLFYAGGRKAVPRVTLTRSALAVWFMDDGCKSYRAVYFNTQQFAYADQQRLLVMLQEQHGITGSLNRHKQ